MTEAAPPSTVALLRRAGIELEARLGAGSSGAVYAARFTDAAPRRRGQAIAVKVLHPEQAGDDVALRQLRTEAAIGRRVRSPHVARIYSLEETVDDDGAPFVFLVMQLVQGRPLRRVIADGAPAVEDLVRRIGLDTARGLGALHRRGVVHRDVKPENLVLTPEGQIVIVDLGLARRGGAVGPPSSGGFYGSVAYAAPEVLAGQRAAASADLYALGLVLFESLTGRHPFAAARTADDMLYAHLHRPPPRASHFEPRCSAFLEQLIGELLEKDAAARPPSAETVADALQGGEGSRYWRRHQREAPVLFAEQRLRAMRRAAPTRFFDRRDQRRLLDRALRAALAGRGGAILLTGPRGIGRRRLLDECLAAWLRAHRGLVLLGGEPPRHGEATHGEPFPAMLLGWFLRGDAPDSPHSRARLGARIAAETDLGGEDSDRLAALLCGEQGDESARLRAERLAFGVLALCRAGHTVVLRVDRVDNLSPTGRLVIGQLLPHLREHRLLLLLVGPAGQAIEGAAVDHLPLGGLEEDAFLRFGASLFEPDTRGEGLDAFLRRAHASTGGSPGNLLDALAAHAEAGELTGRPGRYGGLRVAELRPAAPALQRLRELVEAMAPRQSYVLKAAAVLGETCALADLRALTGQTELMVLEALSMLDDVISASGGRAAFRHRDYRTAILELLPSISRQRMHRAAAWILEARGAPPLEVGLQFSAAAEHVAALPPLERALRALVRAGSSRNVARVAKRMRKHLDAAPASAEREALHREVLLVEAEANLELGEDRQAQLALAAALKRALAAGDRAAAARARLGLARLAHDRGQLLAALDLSDGAARDLDEGTTLAAALTLRGTLRAQLGESERARADADRALAVATATGHAGDPVQALLLLGRLHARDGEFGAAFEALDNAAAGLREAPSARAMTTLQTVRGAVLREVGDYVAAQAELDAAYERSRRGADNHGRLAAGLELGRLAIARNDRQSAAVHLADTLAGANDTRLRPIRVGAGLALERLGVPCAGLARDVEQTDHAALRAEWWLLQRDRRSARGDAAGASEALAEATALERACALPLALRLILLDATGEEPAADAMVAAVAARAPGGAFRRRLRQHLALRRTRGW